MKLDNHDLRFSVVRLPKNLKKLMEDTEWHNNLFVGGGYLRSIVSGEKINDVDVFVKSQKDAELLAYKLCYDKKDVHKTDNAYTVKGSITIQIIFRWVFDKPEDVSNSFDFTICCAVIFYEGKKYDSFCDERFYIDLASKRLTYRSPVRNEDAGGSMLRVLKYYQKGYRIPLDSLGAVISRLVHNIQDEAIKTAAYQKERSFEHQRAIVITGLLREVDPEVDPNHFSHLPASENTLS